MCIILSPLQDCYVVQDLKSTSTRIEPENRNAGCGIIVEEKLFIWGGENASNKKYSGSRYLPCSEDHAFDVWDFATQTWSHQLTGGDVPDLGLGSSLINYNEWLYIYGGLREISFGGFTRNIFSGDLYRISLVSFKWEMIRVLPASPTTIKPSPRYTMGIILHDHRLCMFGGVGPDIVENQDPGAKWVKAKNRDEGVFGWNNEYYEFDLNIGMALAIVHSFANACDL